MYRRARLPLLLQTLLNVATGAIYLGITFRFEHYDKSGHNSRVFITWYFIAAAEALLTITLSNFWRTLSFTRTHLMKRMSLLTVMILGDGIVSIAQNVVTIVKRPDAWSKCPNCLFTQPSYNLYQQTFSPKTQTPSSSASSQLPRQQSTSSSSSTLTGCATPTSPPSDNRSGPSSTTPSTSPSSSSCKASRNSSSGAKSWTSSPK